jgi:hypothetical protein
MVNAGDLRQASRRLAGEKAVPAIVHVGNHPLGPRDFLEASRQLLSGADQAEINPAPQLPDLSGFYHMDEANLAGTWMYSPDFKDEWVSRRLKWQAWTIHM